MTHLISLRRLIRHRAAVVGGIGSFVALLLAVFGPLVAPHAIDQAGVIVRIEDRLQPPGIRYLFGTDHLGTDIFSMVLHGARFTLCIAFGSALLCTIIGTFAGVIAAYFGGWVDLVVTQLVDVLLAFPSLVLAILIAASLGPGATSISLALVFSGWPALARVIRGAALALKHEEFIVASRAIGCSHFRVIVHHLLPNCLPLIVVMFTMRLGVMILAESSLSFLGLGSPAGSPSWGVMVDTGRSYIGVAPWYSIAPASAIALTVTSFNFLGDGFRDLLDPRLRGRL